MKIHIEITDEQHEKLSKLRNKEGRTMQYLVAVAIDIYLRLKRVK